MKLMSIVVSDSAKDIDDDDDDDESCLIFFLSSINYVTYHNITASGSGEKWFEHCIFLLCPWILIYYKMSIM